MGYLTDGLTFNTLREANKARLPLFKNSKGEPAHSEPDGSDWSPSQWLQAVTGELGEYANLRKKFERGDIDQDAFDKEARKEIADIQIYLDILAFRLGINLGEAVKDKFNEVSDRIKCPIYIGSDGDWHRHSESEMRDKEIGKVIGK
jgi:NTP pyrophosphatase (non-canonical NTP hydrolase)